MPWPSNRGSVSVWTKAISPGRRRYSLKPATSPPTWISKRDRSGTSTTRIASGNRGRLERAGLGPAHVQPALGEPPRPVRPGEPVLISERGDHELALAVLRVHVVRQAVGLPRGAIAVERHRALTV